MIGAVAAWIIGFMMLFTGTEMLLPLLALALLLSYLIPGHMLKKS